MIICKYFVLIGYHKRCPKEVDYCCTYQHTKGRDMVNDQLRQLSKYHGLKLFVYLIYHMDFKNPNIRYPKSKRENVNTESGYINGIKREVCDIKSRTYLEVRDKQK